MTEESFEKPRLVPAGQGFSVLNTVEYRGRFLYSKYSPDRAIKETVSKLTVLPGTIILLCSPCLWHGTEALVEAAGNLCLLVALESDKNLLELSKAELESLSPAIRNSIHLMSLSDLPAIDSFIRSQVNTGNYRRILRLDMSAGIQFNREAYSFACSGIQEIIERFWKNRITLSKFGRLYSKNLFKNLPKLSQSLQLVDLKHKVERPILVLGAGESLDQLMSFLKSENLLGLLKEKFYTLAVDAALPNAMEYGFVPDAAVLVEAQFAITKAFIVQRTLLKDSVLFCDLCSRPSISQKEFGFGKTVFFASSYADCQFLSQLESSHIVKEYIQGLGSVGLVAMEIARTIASSQEIPILYTGMDFSYSAGLTHAKNAPAHTTRLMATNRLFSIQNIDAAFSPQAVALPGKNGKTVYTTPAMKSYSEYFAKLNSQSATPALDLSETGLSTGTSRIAISSLKEILPAIKGESKVSLVKLTCTPDAESKERSLLVKNYLAKEKQALETIRDLLVNGESSCHRNSHQTLEEQLRELLLPREYLYLHFPDGYRLSMDIQFLKRVRPELDVFLKLIK